MDSIEHKFTNALIHETSPYLLQHAHNPVNWYPWGDEALARARAGNKPILLSIGYSACHWCHVMERESFENEAIAAVMNKNFINIKVDREERPDLDQIYMNAVQMMTGQGGWPMTMFLTPEGIPFYGGTYFPPDDRYNMPGFPRVLMSVAEAYRAQPDQVQHTATAMLGELRRVGLTQTSNELITTELLDSSYRRVATNYDVRNGGFGSAPKFPPAMVLEFLLRTNYRTGAEEPLAIVTTTCLKMARGGIYDQLGGGFHRYSVDAKWLVPHFEKMLYDNAQLLRIYAQAFVITHEPLFKSVVEESAGYLLREMLHTEGGFYSTQDADSEGEEGKFFVWTPDEISRIIGDEAGEIFCRIYDVTEYGNFEEKNILHPILTLDQASKLFRREIGTIEGLIADAKRKLFEVREKIIKPFRDEKIVLSWNGLMLSGLAEAIKISPQPRYIEAVNRTVDFIITKMFRDGHLLHVYKEGVTKHIGYLDDYAFVAVGLLDLYETTFDRANLARAVQLAQTMLDEFWDNTNGSFFYPGKSHERLISRAKPVFDGSVPSGNAMATQFLLRLYHLTGTEDYLKRAEKVLHSYYDAMESQPFGFAHILCALDL